MNQHVRARLGSVILVVALIAAVFPTPASAIVSMLNGSQSSLFNNGLTATENLDAASGEIISRQSNLLQVTDTPTNTPVPPATNTPIPTVQSGFVRPQIAVRSYRTNPVDVQYGGDFKLFVRLRNDGQVQASNVQVSFISADFLALGNGGVVIVGDLGAGNSVDIEQVLTAVAYLWKPIASVEMNLSYYDETGVTYAEKFTLNI